MKENNAQVRIRMGGAWLALALGSGLGAPVAVAQDQTAEDCAAIESADERLACFDAVHGGGEQPATEAAATGGGGTESQSADVGPAAAAGASTAAAATSTSTSDADFGVKKSRAETEGESMVSGIAAVSRGGYDKLVFELDNGQVWQQIEYKRFPAKAGDVAEIRHGSFSSYKMYIQGKKVSTRVRRTQ